MVAAFVLFHVVASCSDMVPNTGGFSEKSLRDVRAKAELHAWANRLHVDDDALKAFALDASKLILSARRAVRAPFAPYLDAVGVKESWSLFTVALRKNVKFVVEARDCAVDDASCAWRALYRSQDADHRFAADVLESDRTVGAVARFSYAEHKPARINACNVLARRAFAEMASVQAVRCNIETFPSPDPMKHANSDVGADVTHADTPESVDEGKPITRADVEHPTQKSGDAR